MFIVHTNIKYNKNIIINIIHDTATFINIYSYKQQEQYVCKMLHLRSGQDNTVYIDEVADLTSHVFLQFLGVKKRFLSSPKHPDRFSSPPSLLLQRLGSGDTKLNLVPRLTMNGSIPSLLSQWFAYEILYI
jgi:hypothetical protein